MYNINIKGYDMDKEIFEMCFELEEILEFHENGYSNVYDISVDGEKTFLLANGIVSHNSAVGGLIPVLGRKDTGFYALRGKPLNVVTASHEKFRDNKELTELYQIIKHEGYEKIVVATDADLDALHIRGLLIGYIDKMLPEIKGVFGILNTPVIVVKKNGKIVNWSYNLFDNMILKQGEESHYYKGLGSWMEKDLKEIVQKDTLEKMIQMVDFDSDQIIQDWLASENSDIRKDYIGQNSFSIASL